MQNTRIGLAVDGVTARPNRNGVVIDASGNTVRTSVISGNNDDGIAIGTMLTNISILGNRIGLNVAETATVPNGRHGVFVGIGSAAVIGNTTDGWNIISGNGSDGIFATGATNVQIIGNIIGLLEDSTFAGNGGSGIRFLSTTGSTIGSPGAGANTISGNSMHGVNLESSNGNTLNGNRIGTDVAGAAAAARSGV